MKIVYLASTAFFIILENWVKLVKVLVLNDPQQTISHLDMKWQVLTDAWCTHVLLKSNKCPGIIANFNCMEH